jgi:hypothetical protein
LEDHDDDDDDDDDDGADRTPGARGAAPVKDGTAGEEDP